VTGDIGALGELTFGKPGRNSPGDDPVPPNLVQEDFGYTATLAGLVLSPGGIVSKAMMFMVGRSCVRQVLQN